MTIGPLCCGAGPCSYGGAGIDPCGARPPLPPRPNRSRRICRSATLFARTGGAAAQRRSALPGASSGRHRCASEFRSGRPSLPSSDNRAMGRGAAGVRDGAADTFSSPAHATAKPPRRGSGARPSKYPTGPAGSAHQRLISRLRQARTSSWPPGRPAARRHSSLLGRPERM